MKDTDFCVGKKLKTDKGIYQITAVWFSSGRCVRVELNEKYTYPIAELMEKKFEWYYK